MAEEPLLSAKAVREAAGLSYRQIADSDQRGVLPSERGTEAGWRRFTGNDGFVLMVINEIHEPFEIPVQRLRFARDEMSEAGYLAEVIEMMATFGVPTWLMTDLEELFVIDTESECLTRLRQGLISGDEPGGLLLVKLNRLVNYLLARIGEAELLTTAEGQRMVVEGAGLFVRSEICSI